jgi:hypothetical protein
MMAPLSPVPVALCRGAVVVLATSRTAPNVLAGRMSLVGSESDVPEIMKFYITKQRATDAAQPS